jgi:hypothetical protein
LAVDDIIWKAFMIIENYLAAIDAQLMLRYCDWLFVFELFFS